jgi:probable phosphoglycerate mutase
LYYNNSEYICNKIGEKSNMNNTFYIVRHGQTDWNVLGKTQGHGNSNLTEKGKTQAKDLANSLKKYPISKIYTSDLGRAVETANIIGETLGINITKTDLLREMGFGVWEGLLESEIKNNHSELFKIWRNEPHLAKIPNGETLEIIQNRTNELISELNERYENEHILLVTHSITVRVMMLSFLNSGLENIYRIKQDNTALNIVEHRTYGPAVTKMNDTSHCGLNTNNVKSPLE